MNEGAWRSFTRLGFQERLLAEARRELDSTWHEQVRPWEAWAFRRFATAYARERGLLVQDFCGLLVSAKNCLGDTFARVLLERGLGSAATAVEGLEQLRVTAHDLEHGHHRIGFRPRLPRRQTLRRLYAVGLRRDADDPLSERRHSAIRSGPASTGVSTAACSQATIDRGSTTSGVIRRSPV